MPTTDLDDARATKRAKGAARLVAKLHAAAKALVVIDGKVLEEDLPDVVTDAVNDLVFAKELSSDAMEAMLTLARLFIDKVMPQAWNGTYADLEHAASSAFDTPTDQQRRLQAASDQMQMAIDAKGLYPAALSAKLRALWESPEHEA